MTLPQLVLACTAILVAVGCGDGHSAKIANGPIRRVQVSSATTPAGNTSLSTDWPTTTEAGDLLLLAVHVAWDSAVGDITVPREWTLVARTDYGDGFRNVSSALYFQENAPARSGSVTVGARDPEDRIKMVLAEYSGIQPSGSLDRFATLSGNDSRPMTGSTSSTSQPTELWVGVISNIAGFNQCLPSDGFSQVETTSSGASTLGLYETIVDRVGSAGLSVQLGSVDCGGSEGFASEWAGLVATFRG